MTGRPPIRIAHVVEATTGGVARHVIDLVTRLHPDECTSLLYLSLQRHESWVEPFRALEARGITLREIPMAHLPNPGAVRAIAGWAQRDHIDVLHVHSAKAGYLGRQAAVGLDIPVVYTPHAFPFQRTTDWKRPLYRSIERKMAQRTASIICVSTGERDEALAAGLPAEKLVVIPNGLDTAQWPLPTPDLRRQVREGWGIAEHELVVGTMCRMVPQKGIDLLLEAWVDVGPDFPHARLVLCGDGPQRRALRRFAYALRLPRVTFAGEMDDPRPAYAAMDIFCAPSRWEGAPYAVMEAMASGLPVIASEVPGHTDLVVDEETGRFVIPELPGPLAGALRGMLVDDDPWKGWGESGRFRVQRHFAVSTMVRTTADLYHTLVADRRNLAELSEDEPPAAVSA
jgi:glycosyltransferase involved in cell wall biosynthesis